MLWVPSIIRYLHENISCLRENLCYVNSLEASRIDAYHEYRNMFYGEIRKNIY